MLLVNKGTQVVPNWKEYADFDADLKKLISRVRSKRIEVARASVIDRLQARRLTASKQLFEIMRFAKNEAREKLLTLAAPKNGKRAE